METFSALLAICAGNSPATGEFPSQRPVTRSFDVFHYLRLNKRLSNNREARDLRRYRAQYGVIVMCVSICLWVKAIGIYKRIVYTLWATLKYLTHLGTV